MKLSTYVAQFLAKKGISHAFVVTGGASAHLIDSIARTDGIDYICTQHEQAGAMCADAYSRVTGHLGVAIATSGPGATNMLTGVCCAYFDSIPVIYITGQVSSFRLKGNTGVRQLGFQETDVVSIFKTITKYAVLITDPERIRYELEKACYLAVSDRPGPVIIDIPDNLQRADIDPDHLEPFIPEVKIKDTGQLAKQIDKCLNLISRARRPVIILGWGVRLGKAEAEAIKLIETLGIPVLLTWAARDLLPESHPLFVGDFGTHGSRYGNFTVQNSDLVLSIGSRLDTKATGSPMETFAREARKIIVDIDKYELNKFRRFGMNNHLTINCDARDFLQMINDKISEFIPVDLSEWKRNILEWKRKYPLCRKEYFEQKHVNPYVFIKALSKESSENDLFVVDTGCSIAWICQAFEFKKNQRLFSAFNNTPMGYAVPASIGASFALDKKSVVCITGDGGLQMNIQDLSTIIYHSLPIKIFLINNHGYSMIRQTQDQWFNSKYEASNVEHGLAFPDFIKVAKAYGFKTLTISNTKEVYKKVSEVFTIDGPVFCNIEIDPAEKVIPQVKFGRALEDSEPLLDRKEFLENMIVRPMEISL